MPQTLRGYHHGNLRETLVWAAVQLIEEGGIERLSVRGVAKRAGVSPGAPFRHFPTRASLLTAVAEQASELLKKRVDGALSAVVDGTPLQRLSAIGHAYLKWASDNPTHFKVISDRHLIDYDCSLALQASTASIRAQMQQLLTEEFAAQNGTIDLAMVQLASRALVYGLARMMTDGHFPEWSPPGANCENASGGALDLFIDLLSGRSMVHAS